MSTTQAVIDQKGIERIEALLQEIEEFGDPATQSQLREVVQSMLEYHGAAVRRLVELVRQAKGPDAVAQLAQDELVSSLLLLYDLHPIDLRNRVEQALDKVRPYLQSHGGEVELLDVEDGIVQLRMKGSCHGCPSSAQTMKNSIEEAILSLAPDVAQIKVDGVVEARAAEPAGFVSLGALAQTNGNSNGKCSTH